MQQVGTENGRVQTVASSGHGLLGLYSTHCISEPFGGGTISFVFNPSRRPFEDRQSYEHRATPHAVLATASQQTRRLRFPNC